MIADRLAALREAATAGPWLNHPCSGTSGGAECWQEDPHQDIYHPTTSDASFGSLVLNIQGEDPETVANTALALALVNAAPALEALVRAAEKVTERPGSYDSGGSQWWADHDALAAALAELEKVLG